MLKSQLIPYLVSLFSGGQPSGLDYKALIEGLGEDTDRPHLVCVSPTTNIPDNLLLTSEFNIASVAGGSGVTGGGCCGDGSIDDCGCPPAPSLGCGCGSSSSGGLTPTSKMVSAVNILCDWFNKGWEIDCIGISSRSSQPRAYYWVVSKDTRTGYYEIFSAQFDNPGFDKGSFKSECCIRLVRWVYDRKRCTFVSGDARLIVTDLTGAVLSGQVREVRIVSEEPPKVEDNVLYIQIQLPALCGFDVELESVTQSTATFTWDNVANAIGYQYRLGKDGDWVTTMSPCVLSNLEIGTEYFVSFRAVGDGINYGNSDTVSHFFTTLNVSQLPQPTPVVTPGVTSCIVSWNPVDGASSYAIKLGKGGVIHTVFGTSFTFQGLVPGQEYSAHVRAVAASSEVLDSDWIAVSFKTNCN